MSADRRAQLLRAAQSFCETFANQKPTEEIVSHFSESDDVRIWEHGLPELAPFLGREFRDRDGIQRYFDLISTALKYENMSFDDFIVDPETSQVSCRGHAHFVWSSTGQGWDETFAYMLKFDHRPKVKSYEIWADTGAAYLASKSQLCG